MSTTWSDILNDALGIIGSYAAAGDPPEAEDVQTAVRFGNRLLDSWAAKRRYAYSTSFQVVPLTAGHGPTLLGPGLASPDFAWPSRPVRIESASIILTDSTPNVDQPIEIRDAQWWNRQRVKTLPSNIPTDLFYEPDFPNGAANFWPVPNYAYSARLELWSSLGQIPLNADGLADLTQLFVAAPGYERAYVLTLGENLVIPMHRKMPPELPAMAAAARMDFMGNNIKSPRIASADHGTQGRPSARGGGFNWGTGQPG